MNLKSNKAITLVALIITIIVLLILAGVSLSMVLGENGLINKAQSSVNKYQESYVNEQNLLNKVEEYFDRLEKNVSNKVEDTTYSNGQTVSIGGYDFWVIGDDGISVTLLCKTTIGSAKWSSAGSQAGTFGSDLGGSGRLLTKVEAEGVAASYRNIGTSYWISDYGIDDHGVFGWYVSSYGSLNSSYVRDGRTDVSSSYGVRPVVVIPKSKL